MDHHDKPKLLNRLNRIEGQVRGVARMVEEGRDGLVIAQQMQAVIKALEKAKQMLILDHIDHHLGAAADALPPEVQRKIAEFREITKYL